MYNSSQIDTESYDNLLKTTAELTIEDGDEEPVEVKSKDSGAYTGKAVGAGYKPKTGTWSPPTPFVRNGRSHSEDPFQTSGPNHRSGSFHTPKSARIYNENWRSGSRSAGSSGDGSPLQSKSKLQATSKNLTLDLEESRTSDASANPDNHLTSGGAAPSFGNYGNSPIGGVFDAQAFYPPAYCVFVANLLASQPDDDLEAAVTHVFREFGPVWVKIRRDGKMMPFAFCQYTKVEHAERAIREGKGRIINGRPCRTEKAKAHHEARRVLSQFGHLEACYVATPLERATFRLPEGVVAQFELYENGQSAQIGLRNHGVYRFTAIPQTGFPQVPATISPRSGTANSSANIYIARYEIDRRTLFCGNLPAGTIEAEVHDLFAEYGHVKVVAVRETASKYEPTEKLCFAFIEFENVESAQAAADSKLTPKKIGASFKGRNIRVSFKNPDTSPPGGQRTRNGFLPALQSPPTRPFGPRASPMSPAISSPSAYNGSPYSYPYGYYPPNFGAYGGDQSYYSGSPYSPAYYSYAGSSPAYAAPPSASSEVSSSPSYQSGYYSYAAYGYPTSPYWNAPPQSVEQSLGNYYAPTQPATTEANVVTPEGTNITSLDGQVSGTTIDVSAQAP
ncbi:hypothetical protein B0O99DRAFT_728700 [Bisporella sp. PMI_857]|nr:hypothetical protein B0O99DRAFT_728700 [Bisporella sp. PMI_857]